MRRRRRSPRTSPPDLFNPPPPIPTWTSLPRELQQELRQLLAKMLRSPWLARDRQILPKEVSDE